MKILKLHIQNYKSLVDLEIIEPNPFSVFAGSNGAGKSNIFEALEFITTTNNIDQRPSHNKTIGLFGGLKSISNYNNLALNPILFDISLDDNMPHKLEIRMANKDGNLEISGATHTLLGREQLKQISTWENMDLNVRNSWILGLTNPSFIQFFEHFSRLFISNHKILRQNFIDDFKLNADCSNLDKVLKRILKDDNKKDDLISWLDLLIPGFENIEIISGELTGTDNIAIYEKGTKNPFNRNLLSDGTWNILALLTAVYQSNEPQFLCIEEPENGLNPKVQKELINLFRQKCEDEGHYIWLNTHSQTIVNQLTPKELILVDKVDGATQIKQFPNFDLHGLSMDEAWLTNSFGGGLPW